MRDVRDVHHAWEHRVPEEERVALRRRQQQQQAVDGSHAGSYTLHRLLSLTLLLVLVAAFYVFALQATGGAGLVMGPLAPSNPTLFATAQQRAAPPAAPVFAGGKEL